MRALIRRCALSLFVLPTSAFGAQEQSLLTVQPSNTIADLLSNWSAITGSDLSYREELSQTVLESPCGLLGEVVLLPAQIEPLVESLLFVNGIELIPRSLDGERQYVVSPMWRYNPGHIGVVVEDLDEMRAHPALRHEFRLPLSRLDQRHIAVLLRPFVIPGSSRVTSPKSEPLLLSGAGALVRDLANLLLAIDTKSDLRDYCAQPQSFFSPTSGTLEVRQSNSLLDVVLAYNGIADLHITTTQKARKKLAKTKFMGDSQDVPAKGVHTFVSKLLFEHGYVSSIASDELPSVLTIYTEDQGLMARRMPASYRSEADFRSFPSLAVSVPVILKHGTAFQLPAKLRPMIPDPRVSGSVCIGSDCLLVYGRAGNLVEAWSRVVEGDKP